MRDGPRERQCPNRTRIACIRLTVTADGDVRRYLQKLSTGSEFAVVILGAFGTALLATFVQLLFHTKAPRLSSGEVWQIVVYEAIVFTLLAAFLGARNWSSDDIGLRPSLRDTLIGSGLALAAFLLWLALALVFADDPQPAAAAGPTLPLALVVLISVVNPVFEETFVTGYVITVLKRHDHVFAAIGISVALRVLYHLYEGFDALIGIAPGALLFAAWYARSGRLWPVIVAHALLDFVALLPQMA